jgi:hypothetical protein
MMMALLTEPSTAIVAKSTAPSITTNLAARTSRPSAAGRRCTPHASLARAAASSAGRCRTITPRPSREIINKTGAGMPTLQPIVSMTEAEMAKDASQNYDDDNRGALFKNSKKEKGDKRPDYTGPITVNGVHMRVSAWIQKSEGGETYMSLALRPKTEGGDTTTAAKSNKDTSGAPF